MRTRAKSRTALVLVVATSAVPGASSCSEDQGSAGEVPGDVEQAVAGMEAEEMPVRARAFLATDRPWSAARVMREYLLSFPEAPPDLRLLAARAEAGWGAWDRALDLLEGISSLETYGGGIGVFLVARARDDAGDVEGAIEAYRDFLALPGSPGELEEERGAADLRLALALLGAGKHAAGDSALAHAYERAGRASVWLDVLRADVLAAAGDTARVRAVVQGLDDGIPGLRARRARIAAARRAGDVAGARALANAGRGWARTSATQAEFLVEAAKLAIEMGDIARGRAALRGAIDRASGSAHAREAAALLREGDMTPPDDLAVARVYRAQGLNEESLEGFRAWLDAGAGSAGERAAVRLEYATALFYALRFQEALQALEPIQGVSAARYLRARAAARAGDTDLAVATYLALSSEAGRSANAARALYLAAEARDDAGDTDRAHELYRRVVERYAGSEHMGLSLMRLAGAFFLAGDHREAARLWDGYRARYPNGERAAQSTYWAGRAREELGDSAGAAALFRQVRAADRDSYYALVAGQRLGEPFWPLPLAEAPPADPGARSRVAGWVGGLDLLHAAGFPDLASEEALRLAGAVGTEPADMYAMGEALAERGYSRAAIRLGLALQASEEPNERLLRILYPFPFRTMITEEARDRGLDPFVVAALIRQESLFDPRATSHVGARGLMQLMPATGAGVAADAGVEPWEGDLLYHPEINVYLGTRLLAGHMEDYSGSLPAVFSAYNAGPHRVEWWSEYPEYGLDELFTERIPFAETRGYVRILARNRALYAGLYGGGGDDPGGS